MKSLDEVAAMMEASFRESDRLFCDVQDQTYGRCITIEGSVYGYARYHIDSMFHLRDSIGNGTAGTGSIVPPELGFSTVDAICDWNAPHTSWYMQVMSAGCGGIVSFADRLPWEIRERIRMDYGQYLQVPWANQLPPIPGHTVHISTDDMSQVAFTPDAPYGERNRKTRLRPGRYLQRFYPSLDATTIQGFATKLEDKFEVKFAVTADEIEEAYTKGPSSCMSERADHYKSHCHPVRVYGDSDIQLAYLVKDDGKPMARCLVWPEKKVIGRVYGDSHRMKHHLEKLGYDVSSADGHALIDAKIRVIRDEEFNCLVMPYIDGEQRYTKIDNTWAKIGGPSFAGYTNGLNRDIDEDEDTETYRCDHCHDYFEEVFAVHTAEYDTEDYCRGCRDEFATRSERSRYWVHDDHLVTVLNGRREYALESWAEWEAEDLASRCDGLEVYVVFGPMFEMDDGRILSLHYATENNIAIEPIESGGSIHRIKETPELQAAE
jgi:hypothetical protein